MSYRLLASGAFVCALTLLGFAGQADATTRLDAERRIEPHHPRRG